MNDHPRIICISNRLPIALSGEKDKIEVRPSSGGLVTAMGPVLSRCRGIWVGWPGTAADGESEIKQTLKEFSDESEFDLVPVFLDKDAVSQFYDGFSNQI